MIKIVQVNVNDQVLRQKAKEVPKEEIGTEKLNKILAEMNTALNAEEDGVAIAAPQIGVPLRIFIVSRKALPGDRENNIVFINPVLKKLSAERSKMEEGCLSVRWIYGETKRANTAQVEAYNEKGHKFVRTGKGLLAQIFQHETDHLEGILFIDKAKNLKEVPPE
ncbi:MAG: peptide deformylase, partial [Candidatus Vogelbacteria bacterium]|nr:peptide deformylase [Candidatus Vogelbacteria bacterium]